MSLNSSLRGVLGSVRQKRIHASRIKKVREAISRVGRPVPELSPEQIAEIRAYWQPFGCDFPLEWHRLLYAVTERQRPDFIPHPVFYDQVRVKLNDQRLTGAWSDKAYLDRIMKDLPTAKCLVRNVSGNLLDEDFSLIDKEKAETILSGYERVVIKPTLYTHTGQGVSLWHAPYDMDAIEKAYKKNYIVQLPITQHPLMAALNDSSVNCIRVNSLLLDGQVSVVSAFAKVGQAGSFADNSGSDRYFIGIDMESDTWRSFAIDHDMRRYERIPSGIAFAGAPVPGFAAVREMICRAHARLPHFAMAFWDVAIDQSGEPVIVEVNLRDPDTVIAQATGSPFFGDMTKSVMQHLIRADGSGN